MPRPTLFYILCASMTMAAVLTSLLSFLCFFTCDTRWPTPEPWQVLQLQNSATTAEEVNCEVTGLFKTVSDDHRSKVTSGDKAASNKVDVSTRESTRKARRPREITADGYERDEAREVSKAKDGDSAIRGGKGRELTRQVNTKPQPEDSMSRALLLGNQLGTPPLIQGKKFPFLADQASGGWGFILHPEHARDNKDRNTWAIQMASAELKQRLAYTTLIQKPLLVQSVSNLMATDDPQSYLTNKTKVSNTFVKPSSEEGQSHLRSLNLVDSLGLAQQTTDINLHQHIADQKEVRRTTAWTNSSEVTSFEEFSQKSADICHNSNGSSGFAQEKFSLRQLVKNCSLLRLVHRYGAAPVSPEEEDFPLAFAIKLHASLLQAEQLLRTIYRAHNFYCLHVDKRAPDEVHEVMLSLGDCFSNVAVIRDRVSVIYSSAAHVWAELKCMAAALASHVTWRYYINLTGEEFPLRTNLEMVRILTMFHGANDIEAMTHPPHLRWRVDSQFVISGGVLRRTPRTKTFMFPDFPIRKGSAYGAFTRGFVASLFNDNIARALLRWFNDTYAPEENVWATINALPWIPGGYSLEVRHELNQHASRAVAWRWDPYRCKGRYMRSVCIFSSSDLPWLLKQPHLVANKFKTNWDQRVLDCLEEIIFRRAKSREVSFDQSYFANLPHVKLYSEEGRGQVMAAAHNTGTRASLRIKQDWLDKHAKELKFVNVTAAVA